jgi:hypothetical protein
MNIQEQKRQDLGSLEALYDPWTPATQGAEGSNSHSGEAGRGLAVPAKVRVTV